MIDPFDNLCGIDPDLVAAFQSVGPVIDKAHEFLVARRTAEDDADKTWREAALADVVRGHLTPYAFAMPISYDVDRQITVAGPSFMVRLAAKGQTRGEHMVMIEDIEVTLRRKVASMAELRDMCAAFVGALEALGACHVVVDCAPQVEGT